MPSKNRMTADKGDRQHESPESTHSYCNTEDKEKLKKKRPKAGFGSCVIIFPRRLGKAATCLAVGMGKKTPGADAGLGGGVRQRAACRLCPAHKHRPVRHGHDYTTPCRRGQPAAASLLSAPSPREGWQRQAGTSPGRA